MVAVVAAGTVRPARWCSARHRHPHHRAMQRPRGAGEMRSGRRRERGRPRRCCRQSGGCCCRPSRRRCCRRGRRAGPLALGGEPPPTVAAVAAAWPGATRAAALAPHPARRCSCRPRPPARGVAARPVCCRRPRRAVRPARRRCSPRRPPASAMVVSVVRVVPVLELLPVMVPAVGRCCCRRRGHAPPGGGGGTRPHRRRCMGAMAMSRRGRRSMAGTAAWAVAACPMVPSMAGCPGRMGAWGWRRPPAAAPTEAPWGQPMAPNMGRMEGVSAGHRGWPMAVRTTTARAVQCMVVGGPMKAG